MSKNVSRSLNWRSKDYDAFKSGITYYEVWQILRQEKEAGKWAHVTRHTVLGKWHELKLSMYEALLDQFGPGSRDIEIPF